MKKIAVVTGASSGMGADFARIVPLEFDVDEIWLMARRADKLNEVCKEVLKICSDNGKKTAVRVFEVNLSGREGAKEFEKILEAENKDALFETAVSENVSEKEENGIFISFLANNAGFGTYGTFEETEISRELDMIDLNCTSLTGICGYVLKFMGKDSVLVNTASLASFLPLGNFAVYGGTKSFVLSFTVALAAEVKDRGIKVCALCPGPVSTEFANVASNGARKVVRHGLPSKSVVEHCIKCAKKGKKIAIYAPKWKFKAFMSRFVGRYAGALFTFKYCKRPCNH